MGKISKQKIVASILLIVVLMSCANNKSIKQGLIYQYDLPAFSHFNFLLFKNQNDSLIFIISDEVSNKFSEDLKLDSLIENKLYLLELIPIETGLYLKSSVRSSHPVSYYVGDSTIITKQDTLVGTVYKSPNIIGLYYKK